MCVLHIKQFFLPVDIHPAHPEPRADCSAVDGIQALEVTEPTTRRYYCTAVHCHAARRVDNKIAMSSYCTKGTTYTPPAIKRTTRAEGTTTVLAAGLSQHPSTAPLLYRKSQSQQTKRTSDGTEAILTEFKKQAADGGFHRNLSLQDICDTSIARITGFMWPHVGYTVRA